MFDAMWAGCVDAWEPKVLRSGAGAHFHAHSVVTEVAWEQVRNYLPEDADLMLVGSSAPEVGDVDRLAANAGKKQQKRKTVVGDLSQLSPVKFRMINCSKTNIVLLLSSGLTADACQFATNLDGKLVSFPTVDGKDVMNTAVSGSVALFEIARQLRLRTTHTVAEWKRYYCMKFEHWRSHYMLMIQLYGFVPQQSTGDSETGSKQLLLYDNNDAIHKAQENVVIIVRVHFVVREAQ